MQQPTSRQLYAYWDRVRNGRVCAAPIRDRAGQDRRPVARDLHCRRRRPARLPLPPCRHEDLRAVRARAPRRRPVELVGRRRPRRRRLPAPHRASPMPRSDMAASRPIRTPTGRPSFEFVLLPLIHTGDAINRILGAITAIEPPFWLGAEPLLRQEIVELNTALARWRPGVHGARRRRGHTVSPGGASASLSGGLRRRRLAAQQGRLRMIIVLGRKLRRSLTENRPSLCP